MKKFFRILLILPYLVLGVLANTTATWYYPPLNTKVFDLYIPWPYDLFVVGFIVITAGYGIYRIADFLIGKLLNNKR